MKWFISIFAIAFICSGCWFAAIPRHTEIKRPVTRQEIVGRWVLTTDSLDYVKIDGFIPNKGEEVAITLRTNGSYSLHTISAGEDGKRRVAERLDEEGKWSLDYNPTNHFKNELVFHSTRDAVSSIWIALDSKKMILWTSWGDPDEAGDLVYEKAQEK